MSCSVDSWLGPVVITGILCWTFLSTLREYVKFREQREILDIVRTAIPTIAEMFGSRKQEFAFCCEPHDYSDDSQSSDEDMSIEQEKSTDQPTTKKEKTKIAEIFKNVQNAISMIDGVSGEQACVQKSELFHQSDDENKLQALSKDISMIEKEKSANQSGAIEQEKSATTATQLVEDMFKTTEESVPADKQVAEFLSDDMHIRHEIVQDRKTRAVAEEIRLQKIVKQLKDKGQSIDGINAFLSVATQDQLNSIAAAYDAAGKPTPDVSYMQ